MTNENLKWYCVDKAYVTMLQRDVDHRVRDGSYVNGIRPYTGVVLQINGFNYYVPVASPKPKYDTMSAKIDILIIYDTEDGLKKDENSKVLCILNTSNMIPVSTDLLKEVDYDTINELRDFKDDKSKRDYINLLNRELRLIKLHKDRLKNNAEKLYNLQKQGHLYGRLIKTTCDFTKLEEALKKHLSNAKI